MHGVLAFAEYRNRPNWKRVLIGNGPYDAVGVVHLEDGISRQIDCDDALLTKLLPHLKRLGSLKSVNLDGCRGITDTGVHLVAQLSSLEVLNLCHTSVSDEAVDSLVKLRQLRHLDVHGTGISDLGVQRLHRAFPDCRIRR